MQLVLEGSWIDLTHVVDAIGARIRQCKAGGGLLVEASFLQRMLDQAKAQLSEQAKALDKD